MVSTTHTHTLSYIHGNLSSARDTEFTFCDVRMTLVSYCTSLVIIIYIHMYIYVVLANACVKAYDFLHMVTLGHALVIFVVQICIFS